MRKRGDNHSAPTGDQSAKATDEQAVPRGVQPAAWSEYSTVGTAKGGGRRISTGGAGSLEYITKRKKLHSPHTGPSWRRVIEFDGLPSSSARVCPFASTRKDGRPVRSVLCAGTALDGDARAQHVARGGAPLPDSRATNMTGVRVAVRR